MSKIFDAPTKELLILVSKELKKKKEFTPPTWAAYAKTGVHRERPPVESDWWHLRAASVLRKVSLLGPIGVSKLRIKYGGKKRRGHQPSESRKGSGNIIRKILQQLEKAGYVKQVQIGVHKGRKITPAGQSLLDKLASTISKNTKKKATAQTALAENQAQTDGAIEQSLPTEAEKKQKKTRKKKPEEKKIENSNENNTP